LLQEAPLLYELAAAPWGSVLCRSRSWAKSVYAFGVRNPVCQSYLNYVDLPVPRPLQPSRSISVVFLLRASSRAPRLPFPHSAKMDSAVCRCGSLRPPQKQLLSFPFNDLSRPFFLVTSFAAAVPFRVFFPVLFFHSTSGILIFWPFSPM